MRAPLLQSLPLRQSIRGAPWFIAAGLATLLASGWWPAAPTVSGMSLIALGATLATLDRLRGMVALRGVVAIHLFVYLSLYLLFIGAVGHSTTTGPQNGLTTHQALDFLVSAGVMALVLRRSLAAMLAGSDATAR